MSEDRDRALGVRRWVRDIDHSNWICNGEDFGKLLRFYGMVSEEKGKE